MTADVETGSLLELPEMGPDCLSPGPPTHHDTGCIAQPEMSRLQEEPFFEGSNLVGLEGSAFLEGPVLDHFAQMVISIRTIDLIEFREDGPIVSILPLDSDIGWPHFGNQKDVCGRRPKDLGKGFFKTDRCQMEGITGQDEVVVKVFKTGNLLPASVIDDQAIDPVLEGFFVKEASHADRRFKGGHLAAPNIKWYGENPVPGPDIEDPPTSFGHGKEHFDGLFVVSGVLHPELVPPCISIPKSNCHHSFTDRLIHGNLLLSSMDFLSQSHLAPSIAQC